MPDLTPQFLIPAALTAAYGGYLGWDWWSKRAPARPAGKAAEANDVLASLTELLIDIDDHRDPAKVVAAVRACMDVVDAPVVETPVEPAS